MPIVLGLSRTTGATSYTLADNTLFENFTGENILSAGSVGVLVTGSRNTLNVGGHIYGDRTSLWIGDAATDVGNTINILATGIVGTATASGFAGAFYINSAVRVTGSHAAINNAGTVVGIDYAHGISIEQSVGPGTTTITNSGLVLAESDAIDNKGAETVKLTNTGTIRSLGATIYVDGIGASYDGGSGIDNVINKGLMVGSVNLAGGNDNYDGRSGRVTANVAGGTVFGGDGDDALLGGASIDLLNGGANKDTLTGGLAKDSLTGGTGLDQFIFNAVAECGDTITDFSVVDDTIVLKSSAFGGIAKGVLSLAAFHSNTTGLAHDASDRFIYETDTDRLWYDSNGSTAGGVRVMVADLNDAAFTRFDILII